MREKTGGRVINERLLETGRELYQGAPKDEREVSDAAADHARISAGGFRHFQRCRDM